MTVRELEDRLSGQELLEWCEYLRPPEQRKPGNLLDLDPEMAALAFTRG